MSDRRLTFTSEDYVFRAGDYRVHLQKNAKSHSYRVGSWSWNQTIRSNFYQSGSFRFDPNSDKAREKAFDKACRYAEEKAKKWKETFGM